MEINQWKKLEINAHRRRNLIISRPHGTVLPDAPQLARVR
jgi:hypothetical protein